MKNKILKVLRHYTDKETCYEIGELADAIVSAINNKSFSQVIIAEEDEDPQFFGEGYEEKKDQKRLSGQLYRLFDFLMDGEWHSRPETSEKANISLLSLRSRLSDLRQPRNGGHKIESRRKHRGTWEDKMIPNEESFAYFNYLSQ